MCVTINGKIRVYHQDNLGYEIYRANMVSLGKVPNDLYMITKKWVESVLRSEHSSLEFVNIKIEADIRGDVASHIVRHTKGHPRFVVQSHRPDWTGAGRPPISTERKIFISISPYALIQMARQRLCYHTMKETRDFMENIKQTLMLCDDVFLKALGEYLGPDCVYRGKICNNMKTCGLSRHWKDIK